MNFAEILAAARRADAAYIIDTAKARTAFEALGYAWGGQFKDDDSQAVLSRDAQGAVYLSISGTRFSDSKLGDLFDDITTFTVSLGDGVQVTHGAYDGCADIWAWAKAQMPRGTVFNVEGHSLGGWRATYTPLSFRPRRSARCTRSSRRRARTSRTSRSTARSWRAL